MAHFLEDVTKSLIETQKQLATHMQCSGEIFDRVVKTEKAINELNTRLKRLEDRKDSKHANK